MSVNVRFTTGEGVYTKAWIYERASSKGTCVICKTESHNNILIRHKEPKKIIGDTHICHKCLVLISNGSMVLHSGKPTNPAKKRKRKKVGRPKKPGTKAGTKPVKFKCKNCDMLLAKANVKNHYRFKHPDIDRTLIDNLIEDKPNAPVGKPKAGKNNPEA